MEKDRFEKPRSKMSGVGRRRASVTKDAPPPKWMQNILNTLSDKSGDDDKRTDFEIKYDIYEEAAHVNASRFIELLYATDWEKLKKTKVKSIIINDHNMFDAIPFSATITISNFRASPRNYKDLQIISTKQLRDDGIAKATAGLTHLLIQLSYNDVGLLTVQSNPHTKLTSQPLNHNVTAVRTSKSGIIKNPIKTVRMKRDDVQSTLTDEWRLTNFIENNKITGGVNIINIGTLYHPNKAPQYPSTNVIETSCEILHGYKNIGDAITDLRKIFFDAHQTEANAINIANKCGSFADKFFADKKIIAVLELKQT